MEVMSQANVGPWDYGDQALATYKKYAVLHMSLFPYRYAAAQEAAKTGMPLMRALVLQNQNDEQRSGGERSRTCWGGFSWRSPGGG